MDPGYAGSCSAPLGIDPFSLDGGILSIAAAPIPAADQPCLAGFAYTSGILTTYPSFSFTYGYAEMRALLPAGQGLWPAFWTLPQSQAWPPEIDIFEFLGQAPTTLEMHIHSNFGTYGQTSTVPDTSQGFHVYGLDWEGDDVTWYFDGVQQAQAATPSYPDLLADAGATNVPMYVLINLAVGGQGSWPGPPDSSTVFPAVMQVDWVRVYQKP
jgi:beta-glucanase (GH16 family)